MVRIGITVMIFKDGKILLGKRIGSHGDGEYSFPGGHMESMGRYSTREIVGEDDIQLNNLELQYLTYPKLDAPKHYLHINLTADYVSGEPKVREPDKCESWDWYDINNIPLFFLGLFATSYILLSNGRNLS
jgi:8-oxo-dGTP diphosphatase